MSAQHSMSWSNGITGSLLLHLCRTYISSVVLAHIVVVHVISQVDNFDLALMIKLYMLKYRFLRKKHKAFFLFIKSISVIMQGRCLKILFEILQESQSRENPNSSSDRQSAELKQQSLTIQPQLKASLAIPDKHLPGSPFPSLHWWGGNYR